MWPRPYSYNLEEVKGVLFLSLIMVLRMWLEQIEQGVLPIHLLSAPFWSCDMHVQCSENQKTWKERMSDIPSPTPSLVLSGWCPWRDRPWAEGGEGLPPWAAGKQARARSPILNKASKSEGFLQARREPTSKEQTSWEISKSTCMSQALKRAF